MFAVIDLHGGGKERPAPFKKPRQRRCRAQLALKWACIIPHCGKSYASKNALITHARLKHQGYDLSMFYSNAHSDENDAESSSASSACSDTQEGTDNVFAPGEAQPKNEPLIFPKKRLEKAVKVRAEGVPLCPSNYDPIINPHSFHPSQKSTWQPWHLSQPLPPRSNFSSLPGMISPQHPIGGPHFGRVYTFHQMNRYSKHSTSEENGEQNMSSVPDGPQTDARPGISLREYASFQFSQGMETGEWSHTADRRHSHPGHSYGRWGRDREREMYHPYSYNGGAYRGGSNMREGMDTSTGGERATDNDAASSAECKYTMEGHVEPPRAPEYENMCDGNKEGNIRRKAHSEEKGDLGGEVKWDGSAECGWEGLSGLALLAKAASMMDRHEHENAPRKIEVT
eukprot:comp6805_c0_seq1/m.2547 comp6805_c0_seq1/g.2547  ORF comp6805_c0_seq1/g.2547 comp6805_c0_seq1/m.2547 type:complete len:398 (-) comp6805_c0_seq1:42-1235(-)